MTYHELTEDEMAMIAAKNGSHWFSPGTMRFFKCQVETNALSHDGETFYFVSSEKAPAYGERRKYTVRRFTKSTGNVQTLGTFQQFNTLARARVEREGYLIQQLKEVADG